MTLNERQQGVVVRLQGTLTEVLQGIEDQGLTNIVNWYETTATTDITVVALRTKN